VRPLLPLIPLGLAAVGIAILGLTLFRTSQGRPRAAALSSSALVVMLVASIVSILTLTLPSPIGASSRSTILVPFSELRYGAAAEAIGQLVGNAILFMPFGFLAPLRWHRLDSVARILVVSAAFSVVIELLQLVLPSGRQTSVTDVIMNVAGAALGYVAMRALRGLARRAPAATTSQ